MKQIDKAQLDKIIYEQEADLSRHMYLMHWDSMKAMNYRFFQTHIHQAVEFIFCEDGKMDFRTSDASGSVCAHQVLIINSFNSHYYCYDGDFKGYILVVSMDFLKDFINSDKNEFSEIVTVDDLAVWDKLTNQLKNLFETYENMSYFSRKGYLLLLLDLLNDDNFIVLKEKKDAKELSVRIFKYIEDNYANDISLESIADAFCYSKNYFCTLFSNISKNGLSFNNYLNFYRVQKVLEMQQDSAYKDAPIKSLIKSSGFKSPETYYRSLKKYNAYMNKNN